MLVLGSPGSATARLRPAAPGRRRCRRRSAERRGRVDIKRRTVDNSPPLGRVTLRVELTEPRGDGGPRLVDDRAGYEPPARTGPQRVPEPPGRSLPVVD